MSTVTLHEEVVGQVATAANFNSTLASWNAATAAGSINDENLREQGIARKNVADQTVEPLTTGSAWFVEDDGGSPAYAGPDDPVVVGGTAIEIGPYSPGADDIVRVYCTAFITGAAVVGGTLTIVALQRNINGAGWVTQAPTRRPLTVHPVLAPTVDLRRNYAVVHRQTGALTSVMWRLIIETSPGPVTVENAVLFVTITGR